MSKSKTKKQQKKQVDIELSILQQIYDTIIQASDLVVGRSDPGILWLSNDSIDEWNVRTYDRQSDSYIDPRGYYNEPEIREPYHRRKWLQKVTSIERDRKRQRLITVKLKKRKQKYLTTAKLKKSNQPGKILCESARARLLFFLHTNRQHLTKAELKEWNQLKKILCWSVRVRDFYAAVDEKLKALRSKLKMLDYQFPPRWKWKPIKFSNYVGADDAADAWDELRFLIQKAKAISQKKQAKYPDFDKSKIPKVESEHPVVVSDGKAKINIKERFDSRAPGQILFDDRDLQLPTGLPIEVLKRLIENFGRTVQYKSMDDNSSESGASEQLRRAKWSIMQSFKKHKIPCKILSKAREGYVIYSSEK